MTADNDARRLRDFQRKLAKFAYAAKTILSPLEINAAFLAISIAVVEEAMGKEGRIAWMKALLADLIEEEVAADRAEGGHPAGHA